MKATYSIIGIFLAALAVAMLVPAIFDPADAQMFLEAFSITAFLAGGLYLSNRALSYEIDQHQAFLLTSTAWCVLSLFAALPFLFSGMSITDAIFESVSGLTTTGSTVLTHLDTLPQSLLLWRAMLQWIGGVGIIVTSIAILPLLHVGGMQLFRTESSDSGDKELPRAASIASATLWIYLILSILCAISYNIAGMSAFDAITHAMTTLSTGGFSTHDRSMGYFGSPSILWIGTVFMLAGGIPFTMYIKAMHGKFEKTIQLRTFLVLIGYLILALFIWLMYVSDLPPLDALTHIAFNVVSLITTTGFASTDYTGWGPFAIALFFFLTVVGGCTGSTAGGIKIMRFIIIQKMIRLHVNRMVYPRGVFLEKYEGQVLTDDVMNSVVIFIFVFLASLILATVSLQLFGLDFETSISGAATALANVGPGIGTTIGPAGNFQSLPNGAKWVLAFAMLLGRLEFMTMLVLFLPLYWKK